MKMPLINSWRSACEDDLMCKFSFVVAVSLAVCCSALGQEVPRVEVFGGYSYLNIDVQSGVPSTSPIPRQSANGWEASVSVDVRRWIGVEGSVAGYYKTVPLGFGLPNASVRDYSFAAGPRFNYRPVFVHALFGGDHLSGSISGISISVSQDSFAAAFGGGVVWPIIQRWALRGSADYVLTRHDIVDALLGLPGRSLTQHNFRASAGIVYVFGGHGEPAPRAERKTVAPQPCAGSSEAALLGVVGCSADSGLRVTSVRSGSPAAQAGIAPGDIVISIEGRPVQSSHDIEAAIAANTSGTIKISYMIKGNWLTERQAKVR